MNFRVFSTSRFFFALLTPLLGTQESLAGFAGGWRPRAVTLCCGSLKIYILTHELVSMRQPEATMSLDKLERSERSVAERQQQNQKEARKRKLMFSSTARWICRRPSVSRTTRELASADRALVGLFTGLDCSFANSAMRLSDQNHLQPKTPVGLERVDWFADCSVGLHRVARDCSWQCLAPSRPELSRSSLTILWPEQTFLCCVISNSLSEASSAVKTKKKTFKERCSRLTSSCL